MKTLREFFLPCALMLAILAGVFALSYCAIPFFPRPIYHIFTGFHSYFVLSFFVTYFQLKLHEKDSIAPEYIEGQVPADLVEEATIYVCDKCRRIRRPRTKHCHVLDACVLRYDHYCYWLNCCIGECNYAYFYKFLILAAHCVAFTVAVGVWGYVEKFLKGGLGLLMPCLLILFATTVFLVILLQQAGVQLRFNLTICQIKEIEALLKQGKISKAEFRNTLEQNPFNRGKRENQQEWLGYGLGLRLVFLYVLGFPRGARRPTSGSARSDVYPLL